MRRIFWYCCGVALLVVLATCADEPPTAVQIGEICAQEENTTTRVQIIGPVRKFVTTCFIEAYYTELPQS